MGILNSLWVFTFCFSAISIQLIHSEQLIGKNNTIYTFEKETFRRQRFLGKGGFGLVVEGKKILQNSEGEIDVALKFEIPKDGKESSIKHESKIYPVVEGHKSIPKFYDFIEDDKYDVLIIELLGRDLSKLKNDLKGFSVKTTMTIGLQVLDVIEHIHNRGVVHSDIKPENIAIGLKNDSDIYLFDFGLAFFYKENGSHVKEVQEVEGGGFRGTYEYCSAYATTHTVLSRRDDIESLAYMLISFVEGLGKVFTLRNLLLQGVKTEKEIGAYLINESSRLTFSRFLTHAFSLGFQQKPDYNFLKKLLQNQLLKAEQTIEINEEKKIVKPAGKLKNFLCFKCATGQSKSKEIS